MTRVVCISQSEKIEELEKDLAMYRRHLAIDVMDDLPKERDILGGLKAIISTWKELSQLKGECY